TAGHGVVAALAGARVSVRPSDGAAAHVAVRHRSCRFDCADSMHQCAARCIDALSIGLITRGPETHREPGGAMALRERNLRTSVYALVSLAAVLFPAAPRAQIDHECPVVVKAPAGAN